MQHIAILRPYITIYREIIWILLVLKFYMEIYGSIIAEIEDYFNNMHILPIIANEVTLISIETAGFPFAHAGTHLRLKAE